MKRLTCPNCGQPVSRSNEGCLLHDFVQVLRERDRYPERKLRERHAGVDLDSFWEDVARILDGLAEGGYSR